jgi:hypothetical protein
MEWFLTTNEGIASLQGLTSGLSLEQIRQRTANSDVLTLSFDDADDNRILKKKKKKKKSSKAGAPTMEPTSPGEMVSNCARFLNDPSINCDTIASMTWFLTTDEGIASLQGLVEGMDAERIVQRNAMALIFKEFNIEVQGNECDWTGISCNPLTGKVIKIELRK